MPRAIRIIKKDIVYHLLNRANGKLRIFKKARDFEVFEEILAEAINKFHVRITGYCIMSNHWHMVAWPRKDNQLSEFMKWLTVTHAQRWHTAHGTTGMGHLYQGRYKSFPTKSDEHYLTLLRYVESNPLRAEIVGKSQSWPWSSLALRNGRECEITLSDGPVELPRRWNYLVNLGANDNQKSMIDNCIKRGCPYGDEHWVRRIIKQLGLESSIRPIGRPKNGV